MNSAYDLISKNGELQRNIINEIIENRNWILNFQQLQFTPAHYFNNPVS